MSFHPAPAHHHRPQRSTLRFLAVVLAYLIIGTLLWWIVGLAMPNGPTTDSPNPKPYSSSQHVVVLSIR
jgi:hypothetical protein